MPDSRDTCGRKPYPEIKIADLKIFEEFWGGGGRGAQTCRHSVAQFELASSVITQNDSWYGTISNSLKNDGLTENARQKRLDMHMTIGQIVWGILNVQFGKNAW